MNSISTKLPNFNARALISLTIFGAYFYAFMEWLFFVTKPSSLSVITWFDKLVVLFVTGGMVALTFLLCLALLSIPALLISNPILHPRLLYLSYLAPAFALSLNALILFDNFTYTVFQFRIITTTGIWKGLYTIGFIIFFWQMIRSILHQIQKRRKLAFLPALGLMTIAITMILSVVFTRGSELSLKRNYVKSSADRPNILILAGDGLNAQYLSLYGYIHDTTPFLKELAKTSLVAENAFTNASGTTASTTSMLTGREPATVKVYRYPDVLEGDASFQHLPGILKREGYETVEIGTIYYMDAHELNLLDCFDIVNSQPQNQPILNSIRAALVYSPSVCFISTIAGRASERLLH